MQKFVLDVSRFHTLMDFLSKRLKFQNYYMAFAAWGVGVPSMLYEVLSSQVAGSPCACDCQKEKKIKV